MFMIISHIKWYLEKNYILYIKKKLSNIEHQLVLIVEITCPQASKQANKHTPYREDKSLQPYGATNKGERTCRNQNKTCRSPWQKLHNKNPHSNEPATVKLQQKSPVLQQI